MQLLTVSKGSMTKTGTPAISGPSSISGRVSAAVFRMPAPLHDLASTLSTGRRSMDLDLRASGGRLPLMRDPWLLPFIGRELAD